MYVYDIEFCPTGAHGNFDGLSCLPLTTEHAVANPVDPSVYNVMQMNVFPVKATDVIAATRSDPILSKILYCLRYRWPEKIKDSLAPFWRRRDELSIEGYCILWGTRVVVPTKLRSRVLDELNQGHSGVVRMKALVRMGYVRWPALDKAVEECAKACSSCQANQHSPAKASLHPWIWPTVPWERVHADFAGPVMGKILFIAIDADSKWPEVYMMDSITSLKTIAVLHEIFARFGLPRQIISDNGPQFTSSEFNNFLL